MCRFGDAWLFPYQKKPAGLCGLGKMPLAYRIRRGMGIVSLRIGKVRRVEVNGEQMRVVFRIGRATEFSVRDVSSVSRSLGWIVLYDREFKTLAKVDSYLEDMIERCFCDYIGRLLVNERQDNVKIKKVLCNRKGKSYDIRRSI